jgi:hypothetical protein
MANLNLENERVGPRRYLLPLLALSFMLIYFVPELGLTEFRWRKEGLYSAIALEMNFRRPNTIAHGELISETYPLFPMVTAVLLKSGVPVSMASRLASVIFVLASSVTIYFAALRAYDLRAALVSASFFFSSLVVIDKGMEGYPETLSFFWILCAWLSWFVIGMQRAHWHMAWLISFSFCGLAFYTTGWEALFYFFLPLVFMRRPLSIWSRMNKVGFYSGLTVLVFFVLIWSYPRWIAGHDIPFRNIAHEIREIRGGYFKQLLFFPIDFFLRTFPWIFILLPVFCAAYDNTERNPIFSRFMKTIFFTLFFLSWAIPETNPRKYPLIIIPLAILAGSQYEIFTRRNSLRLNSFLIFISRLIAFVSLCGMIFYIIPSSWIPKFFFLNGGLSFHSAHRIFGIPQCALSLLIYANVERALIRRRLPVFLHLLAHASTCLILFWAIVVPYRSQDSIQRKSASIIRESLGEAYSPDLLIYETSGASDDFYGIFAYLECKIKRLKNGFQDIPSSQKHVYLLSPDVPIMPERLWTKKATIGGEKRNTYLWNGEFLEHKNDGI